MQDGVGANATMTGQLAKTPSGTGPDHARTLAALRERVKELDCLYAITRLSQRQDLALDGLLAGVVAVVARSWQYPEITCVRVEVEGRQAATPHEGEPVRRQTSPVLVGGKRVGTIEVGYLETRPDCDEGPFLTEERHLLEAVAEHLGRIVAAGRTERRLRELSRELIRAQEAERQRIARELHDGVAQDLSSLRLGLAALAERLERPDPDGLAQAAAKARDLAAGLGGAIASLRDLSYDLLPPALAQLGLAETVFRLCEAFGTRHGLVVDCFTDGMDLACRDFETGINLFRVLQEALTNAWRHAKAGRVTVRLLASYPTILLRVEDDGCGFDPERRLPEALAERRMGLWSMGERVRLLGGRLRLQSRPGQGTTIVAEVPWREEA
jgi:signal transduction histidine kinase